MKEQMAEEDICRTKKMGPPRRRKDDIGSKIDRKKRGKVNFFLE